MPRPKKCRKVCQMPATKEFQPIGDTSCKASVILTVDEYEAIRLIDKQGFSQEECSNYMQVARTTVQLIYNSARKKLADALVDGLSIRIEGGDFQLCDGNEDYCGCGGCRRHRRGCVQQNIMEDRKTALCVRARLYECVIVEEKGDLISHFSIFAGNKSRAQISSTG